MSPTAGAVRPLPSSNASGPAHRRLVTQAETQVVHTAQQMALRQVHLGKQRCQPLVLIQAVRPGVLLPDVRLIFAIHAVITRGIRRTAKHNRP